MALVDVLGAMRTILRTTLVAWLAAVALAACSVASGPPPTSPPTNPVASGSVAAAGAGSTSSGSTRSGSGGVRGTGGIAVPNPSDGGLPPVEPTLVVARPGRLDTHPVMVTGLEARVEGSHAIVQLSWWSGVAPCSVLDSVVVDRAGATIALTVREGADQLGVACIELAQYKATLVDLGPLAPGMYTISALGEVTPVTVTVR